MAFNWRELVRNVCPAIAAALGGPLAGAAMKALSTAVLGKPDATEEEISTQLAGATPQQLLELKEADNQFAEQMAQIGIERDRLSLEDLQSARLLARTDHTADYLAWIYTAGYFAVVMGLWIVAVPADVRTLLQQLFGALTAAQIMILHFYFGGTHKAKGAP